MGETSIIALEVINDMFQKNFGFYVFESIIVDKIPTKSSRAGGFDRSATRAAASGN